MSSTDEALKNSLNTGVDLDALFDMPDRQRVLIVDDEQDTVYLLKQILLAAGFNVIGATDYKEALRKAAEIPPDIILLDLMMPDMDGWETFRRLRDLTQSPVIIISAKATKEDVVSGLQLGVDDYLTKPFFNDEVVARVRTVLRRAGQVGQARRLVFPEIGLKIDLTAKEVSLKNRAIHLTTKEYGILEILARQAPQMVTYQTIADELWGENNRAVRNRIKYLVYRLRQKIEEEPGSPSLIVNSGGWGYRLQSGD